MGIGRMEILYGLVKLPLSIVFVFYIIMNGFSILRMISFNVINVVTRVYFESAVRMFLLVAEREGQFKISWRFFHTFSLIHSFLSFKYIKQIILKNLKTWKDLPLTSYQIASQYILHKSIILVFSKQIAINTNFMVSNSETMLALHSIRAQVSFQLLHQPLQNKLKANPKQIQSEPQTTFLFNLKLFTKLDENLFSVFQNKITNLLSTRRTTDGMHAIIMVCPQTHKNIIQSRYVPKSIKSVKIISGSSEKFKYFDFG